MLKRQAGLKNLSLFFSSLFYFYLFSFGQRGLFVSSYFYTLNLGSSFWPTRAPIPAYLKEANKVLTRPTLRLPRRVRERIVGGLFLRFLEAFFGSKVFFFFVRNA